MGKRDYLVTKALPSRVWNCEFFGGAETCWIKSTLRDNPHLSNPDSYEAELRASCFGDESKIAAEVYGDWGQVTAGFFGSCLSIDRSMLKGDFEIPQLQDARGVFSLESRARHVWIGADWGTASPACAILLYQVQEPTLSSTANTSPVGRGWRSMRNTSAACNLTAAWSGTEATGASLRPSSLTASQPLYRRSGFVLRSIPPKRVIMDSAVTAQLGFGGYADPVTLSTEFKKVWVGGDRQP